MIVKDMYRLNRPGLYAVYGTSDDILHGEYIDFLEHRSLNLNLKLVKSGGQVVVINSRQWTAIRLVVLSSIYPRVRFLPCNPPHLP